MSISIKEERKKRQAKRIHKRKKGHFHSTYPGTSSQIRTERSRSFVRKANDLVRALLGHRASQSAHPGHGVSGLIAGVTHFSSPPLKASLIDVLAKELFPCPAAS